MTQSDMAETLAEIYKIDPNFDKEVFVKECQFEIIPTVLEAYLQGRQDIIKDWCHEGVCALIRIITSLMLFILCTNKHSSDVQRPTYMYMYRVLPRIIYRW